MEGSKFFIPHFVWFLQRIALNYNHQPITAYLVQTSRKNELLQAHYFHVLFLKGVREFHQVSKREQHLKPRDRRLSCLRSQRSSTSRTKYQAARRSFRVGKRGKWGESKKGEGGGWGRGKKWAPANPQFWKNRSLTDGASDWCGVVDWLIGWTWRYPIKRSNWQNVWRQILNRVWAKFYWSLTKRDGYFVEKGRRKCNASYF